MKLSWLACPVVLGWRAAQPTRVSSLSSRIRSRTHARAPALSAEPVSRRGAGSCFAALALLSVSVAPASAVSLALPDEDAWWTSGEGILQWVNSDRASVSQGDKVVMEVFSVEFVTYLSRFLLNFDDGAAHWWTSQEARIPPSYDRGRRRALRARKFAAFVASVEYGLRKYTGAGGRQALLESLESQHGSDAERRRHLALAFTLLSPREQPVAGIARLLEGVPLVGGSRPGGGSVGLLLPPLFSPGLADYLEADPLALMPRTQLPVRDEKSGAFEIRGLVVGSSSSSSSSTKQQQQAGSGVFGRFDAARDRPVVRERPLDLQTYCSFAAAGVVGCAGTHALLVPLDVVKTRLQLEPGRYEGVLDGATTIAKEEGPNALFAGLGPTVVGYAWYGATVYPGFEFASRFLTQFAESLQGGDAERLHAPIVLLSGAASTVLACVGVCPAEALRIRLVADTTTAARFADLTLAGAALLVVEQEGAQALFAGFRPLLARQVVFGMVKFFFFDSLAESIFEALPAAREAALSRLAVSLVAGLVAGTVSSLVSQPADAVLSAINTAATEDSDAQQTAGRASANEPLTVLTAAQSIFQTYGLGGFYFGATARCAWSGLVIAGQFAVYDALKSALSVANPDLSLLLDVNL